MLSSKKGMDWKLVMTLILALIVGILGIFILLGIRGAMNPA
jgi:hypothetical protein